MSSLSNKLVPAFYRHKYIIAYRIEDKDGNSPFYITSTKNHFAENVYPDYEDYYYAYLNMTKFLEPEYYVYYKEDKYILYEYLLLSTKSFIDYTGAVCYRSDAVLSKSKIRKGRTLWQKYRKE